MSSVRCQVKRCPAIFFNSLNVCPVIKKVLHIHISSVTAIRSRRGVHSDALGVSVTRCHVQSRPTLAIGTRDIRLVNDEFLQTEERRGRNVMRSCVYGNDLIVSMTRGPVKSIPSFVINSVYFRPVIKENLRARGCALHWRALLEGLRFTLTISSCP